MEAIRRQNTGRVLGVILVIFASYLNVRSQSSLETDVPLVAPAPPATGDNCGFGIQALNTTVVGPGNTALGNFALMSDANGEFNTAAGWETLNQNINGSSNTGLGHHALYTTSQDGNYQGNFNTAIGASALYTNLNGFENTADGKEALYNGSSGAKNTATGYRALYNNEISGTGMGNNNTANGYSALYYNDDGFENTGDGCYALNGNYGGYSNVAFGFKALLGQQGGMASGNTAIGHTAMRMASGSIVFAGFQNTATGKGAMYTSITGRGNSVFGPDALYSNTWGARNVAFGIEALWDNINGDQNVAIGPGALYYNEHVLSIASGIYNTAVGAYALQNDKGSRENTAFGYQALMTSLYSSSPSSPDQYSDNSMCGAFADVSTAMTNSGAMGYAAVVDSANKIRIGNTTVTYVESAVAVTPSDGRFKYDIRGNEVKGLDFIKRLRPVVYNFDTKKYADHLRKNVPDSIKVKYPKIDYRPSSSIRHTGFIAQEVERAANEANYDFSGIEIAQSENTHYSLAYDQFVVPLVKAVQEQQMQIVRQRRIEDSIQKAITFRNKEIEQFAKLILPDPLFDTKSRIPVNFKMDVRSNKSNAEVIINYTIPNTFKNSEIVLYNLEGKKKTSFACDQDSGIFVANKTSIPAGIYVLAVFSDGQMIGTKNVVISK